MFRVIFAIVVLLLPTTVLAHEVRTGDLVINHPVIPAPIKAQPVAAGYLQIINNGEKAERLVSVEAEFSATAQVHTMKLVEGVMRMRPVSDGLDIPAGETVILKKGGLHLMFGKFEKRPEVGEFQKVILNFARAGKIEVEMLVIDPADLDEEYQAGDGHSGHEHSGHGDHSSHSGHQGHSE